MADSPQTSPDRAPGARWPMRQGTPANDSQNYVATMPGDVIKVVYDGQYLEFPREEALTLAKRITQCFGDTVESKAQRRKRLQGR